MIRPRPRLAQARGLIRRRSPSRLAILGTMPTPRPKQAPWTSPWPPTTAPAPPRAKTPWKRCHRRRSRPRRPSPRPPGAAGPAENERNRPSASSAGWSRPTTGMTRRCWRKWARTVATAKIQRLLRTSTVREPVVRRAKRLGRKGRRRSRERMARRRRRGAKRKRRRRPGRGRRKLCWKPSPSMRRRARTKLSIWTTSIWTTTASTKARAWRQCQ
mmetsp:Transcript_61819/g.165610  ORF Transcript_61819/g.165610 Transcript_61819/m.165610 type:complete len:215 (+) Transcript_61819:633-1277(+)